MLTRSTKFTRHASAPPYISNIYGEENIAALDIDRHDAARGTDSQVMKDIMTPRGTAKTTPMIV